MAAPEGFGHLSVYRGCRLGLRSAGYSERSSRRSRIHCWDPGDRWLFFSLPESMEGKTWVMPTPYASATETSAAGVLPLRPRAANLRRPSTGPVEVCPHRHRTHVCTSRRIRSCPFVRPQLSCWHFS